MISRSLSIFCGITFDLKLPSKHGAFTHCCSNVGRPWPNIETELGEYPCLFCAGHSPNAVSMLVHRLRQWPSIEAALGKYPVFAGWLRAAISPIYTRVWCHGPRRWLRWQGLLISGSPPRSLCNVRSRPGPQTLESRRSRLWSQWSHGYHCAARWRRDSENTKTDSVCLIKNVCKILLFNKIGSFVLNLTVTITVYIRFDNHP